MKVCRFFVRIVLSYLVIFVFLSQSWAEGILDLSGDPRYDAAKSFVESFGYRIDEKGAQYRDTEEGVALLVPVIKGNENKGLVSWHNGALSISLMLPHGFGAYEVVQKDDGNISIVKRSSPLDQDAMNDHTAFLKTSFTQALTKEFFIKTETGHDWCMYISKVGIHYACWSPSDNPFGYYFVTTYRKGDPITWNHYAWYSDWHGYAISCPLNQIPPWNPMNWVQCGIPPQ